jgi:hypothetical protein
MFIGAELPEARAWLETYRKREAYAGVLLLMCWGPNSLMRAENGTAI